MFESTAAENFKSWDKFLDAYYEPIRTALQLVPYIGAGQADDLAQSFFLKMYERRILEKPPAITGRFRNWLYVAARRHAVDEWRKTRRRPERLEDFHEQEPADPRPGGPEDAGFDVDEFYALSVLHMTVERVRKHFLAEAKSEHWMIFEELVLAPLVPGRVAKTREELLAMFPDSSPVVLDNRVTTVKRVFRRMLPALLPADPIESQTADERLEELLQILRASKNNRLWLAFLTNPVPVAGESTGSSLELAARSSGDLVPEAIVAPEIIRDELGILLGFWLEMPMQDYLDELEQIGRAIAAAIPRARTSGALGARRDLSPPLTLKGLITASDTGVSAIPPQELKVLLERLKTFAKRVHRSATHANKDRSPAGAIRRDNAMPTEIAQVLYNLAGALALNRCDTRIIGLSDARFQKNISWVLKQPWLDVRLRPVFFAALAKLDVGPALPPS